MSAVNQEYLLTIVTMGLGFDVPQIQQALEATGNTSVEDAVNFLLSGGVDSGSKSSKTTTAEIRESAASMSISETGGEAHVLSGVGKVAGVAEIASAEEAAAVKRRLKEEAMERKRELEREEKDAELRVADERRLYAQLQKEKEAKAAIHRERTLAHRKRVAKTKKAKSASHKKQVLQWHHKHEAYRKKEARILEETVAKRVAQESELKSPGACLDVLFERYGDVVAAASVKMIIRILTKIKDNPSVAKFRKVNLSNGKIKTAIVTPLGALKFMKFVGFEEVVETDAMDDAKKDLEMKSSGSVTFTTSGIAVGDSAFLVMASTVPIEPNVVQALACLRQRIQRSETVVLPVLRRLLSEATTTKRPTFGIEDLYFASRMLYETMHNLRVSELKSEHLKYLYVDDPIFKARIGACKVLVGMIRKLCGFSQLLAAPGTERALKFSAEALVTAAAADSGGAVDTSDTRKTEAKALEVLKTISEDIALCMAKEMKAHLTLYKLQSRQNASNPTVKAQLLKFYQFILKAVNRILDEPLEEKWRRPLSVAKMKAKWPLLVGIPAYLRCAGFVKDVTSTASDKKYTVNDTSPVNMHLLQFQRDLLNAALCSL